MNLYDGKSTIQSLLFSGKKKVNDGSINGDDGIKGESEWRLKLLEDEKVVEEGSRQ